MAQGKPPATVLTRREGQAHDARADQQESRRLRHRRSGTFWAATSSKLGRLLERRAEGPQQLMMSPIRRRISHRPEQIRVENRGTRLYGQWRRRLQTREQLRWGLRGQNSRQNSQIQQQGKAWIGSHVRPHGMRIQGVVLGREMRLPTADIQLLS